MDYPATFVMTGNFDDRVSPWHSFKYAARLQELNTSHNPILLHTTNGGGHGGTTKYNKDEFYREKLNKLTFLIQFTR